MIELLVATNNAGKQEEFRRLLRSLPARLVTPGDIGLELVPDEPHDSYEANATAKAEAFGRASGLLTVADDAGIEVAALGWGPGVRTARFGADAGRADGVAHLLERLAETSDRRARMVCALAVAVPGEPAPPLEVFRGVMRGSIATQPRGSGGFGFDPVFELGDGRTVAELAPEEKDRRSHRGRAVRAALPRLDELLRQGYRSTP